MAAYVDLANLRANVDFLHRVEIAVAKFAIYILGEDPSTANHNARYRWAASALLNPTGVAAGLISAVVLDDNIQANLENSTDEQIQSAVESRINLMLV